MTSRTYLIGVPLSVTVEDDGTVTACAYLEDVPGDLENDPDQDDPVSDDQFRADVATIGQAFDAGRIHVDSNSEKR